MGFKGDKKAMPVIPDEGWKDLGFQGTDPATDFRGVGIFGLEQLVYLANGVHGRKIYEEAQYGPFWYSFSVVALNITNAICTLLKTNRLDKLIYSTNDASDAGGLILLNNLYVELMIIFHREWMASKPTNLFAFNDIFARSFEKFELGFL